MYRLIVENERGQTLELTGNRNYDVLSVSGTNPPVAAINTVPIVGVDGTRFNSSRTEQRNIVLSLNIQPPIETNRLLLYEFFKVKRWVKLYYKNRNRDVYIEGYVESFENNPWTKLQQPQISIICPQPYWLAKTETRVRFSASNALFEFPFSIPDGGIEFSTVRALTTATINAGEVETGCVITLYADANGVENPKIYNNTTGDFFGVNVTMQAGDVITINSLKGEKSVFLQRGTTKTNLLGDRASGSAWIVLAPELNELTIDAAEGLDKLRATVHLVQKFEGV